MSLQFFQQSSARDSTPWTSQVFKLIAANVQRKTLKDLQKAWRTLLKTSLKKLQQAQLLRAGSILLHNTRFLIISFLTNSCDDQSIEAHKDKIKNNAKGYEADTAVATLFAEGISAQMYLFFKLLGITGARSVFCKYHNQLA